MQKRIERNICDNSVPVVILVSSQHGGLGVIRSLGREGVPVYGVHQSLWEPAARSRYLRQAFRWNFSSASASQSVDFLLDVARRVGSRPILLPTSDETALLVAEEAPTLAREFRLATPPAELVRTFSSKKRMSDLCNQLGIPTPQTVLPQSRDEVSRFAKASKFPVIVKGEDGEFLRNQKQRVRVAIVLNLRELLEIYELNAAAGGNAGIILQEYLPGNDDTIWMFNGYFNHHSECLFGATGRKLRQFPTHRGSTSLGICLRNDAVESQTVRLMQAVGYRGPLDLGFRFDARDGQYKLLDVNPRIGATSRLFVADNGLDVARSLYLDLTGQTVPQGGVREGRKWMVESNDLVSSWTYFRERQLNLRAWIRSFRGVEEGVWLAGDDVLPLVMLPSFWFHKRLSTRVRVESAASKKELAA